MRKIAIAGLQLELAVGDNLEVLGREIRLAKARQPWLEMIVLSELCTFGPDIRRAQASGGVAETHFCRLARECDVWLIPGSHFVRRGEHVFNQTLAISPKGEIAGRYDKMFPWQPYEAGVTPGCEFCVFDIPHVGRVGLSICYDMWFPEVARALAWQGAELILTPSQTNTIDRDVELSIARATAAMNQCFVFNINGAGDLAVGRSIVCGPGGEVLYQAGQTRECFSLEIDLDNARCARDHGWNGLGQVLKSFRDTSIGFPQYRPGASSPELEELGPLRMKTSTKMPAQIRTTRIEGAAS